jgi:TP901-1 family phage major tail protein
MAELMGRKVTIKVATVAVATARTKSLTINNEVVDITSDNDAGIQQLLTEPGQKSVEISVDGMLDPAADALVVLALNAANASVVVELDYTTYKISGTFLITSYSETGTYNDAVTFSASFTSSGVITKGA